MTKTPKSYLYDIISYGEKVGEYLEKISSLEDYEADERTKLAIERCIEIVCEASHKLKKNHNLIMDTYDRAYNFRGSLTHQYDEIKAITIYSFATIDIPNIVEEAQTLLEKN